VQSAGVLLHVRSAGASRAPDALIAIHGGPGLSHHYLLGLEKLASPSLRVVTYDQRGVGQSQKPPLKDGKADPAQYTIALFVADLEAVIASLHAERVHLLGHSWGGMVAQAYVAAHPEGAASLALVSAIPPESKAFEAGAAAFQQRVKSLRAEGVIPPKAPSKPGDDCTASVRALLPAYHADPRLPPTPEMVAMTCHGGIGAAVFANFDNFDYRKALAAYRGRALVFEGKSDPFGLGWADQSAAALSSARLDKVTPEACGHFPWVECPQPFYAALEKLLSR
jgi:pimeloyl-ACP methyl ester carboxylesterase